MKSILVELGWIFNRSCNCGGYFNEVYQKGKGKEIEVWIQPGLGTFQLKKYGDIIKKKTPADKIRETVQSL